jgi:hypothetical protein
MGMSRRLEGEGGNRDVIFKYISYSSIEFKSKHYWGIPFKVNFFTAEKILGIHILTPSFLGFSFVLYIWSFKNMKDFIMYMQSLKSNNKKDYFFTYPITKKYNFIHIWEATRVPLPENIASSSYQDKVNIPLISDLIM